MIVSYKTEINPTSKQIQKIKQTIGTCRYIYNFYLATQKERYKRKERLQSAMDFSKWLNNEYLPQHKELSWIKEVSSKSVKQSILNAYSAYQRFFKKQSGFPRFKKKGKSEVKMYFVKTDAKATILCERHRIKIPTLGWVRLKEKGYIPITKKGETTQKNIQNQKRKIQKIHQRLDNIRTDYINQTIAKIVKTKPSYITIEDLNISGMMKNKHLSKAVSQQKLYEFRTKLTNKCHQNGIEVRVVDRWFPSSKICNCCGSIKRDLKLSDRIYTCPCGYVEDRDYNASLNLRDCKDYKIA